MLPPATIGEAASALPPGLGISVSQVRRICIDMDLEAGVPVLFVGLRPSWEDASEGSLPEVPLYVEPGPAGAWPGEPANR